MTRYLAEIDLVGREHRLRHGGPGGSDGLFGRWGGSTLAVDRVITDDVRELVQEADSELWLLSACAARVRTEMKAGRVAISLIYSTPSSQGRGTSD